MYLKNIPDIPWQISDKSKKSALTNLKDRPMESGDTPVPWGTSRITKTQTQLRCFHMAQCSWTNPPNHSSVQCLGLRLALEHSACLSPSQQAPGHVQSSGQGLKTSAPHHINDYLPARCDFFKYCNLNSQYDCHWVIEVAHIENFPQHPRLEHIVAEIGLYCTPLTESTESCLATQHPKWEMNDQLNG